MKRWIAAAATTAALLAPTTASAAPTVLNTTGSAGGSQPGIACTDQSDGTRFCQGTTTPSTPSPTPEVSSFDGTALDVNVALPRPAAGGDGHYPLIIIGHGWGGQKQGYDGREAWYPTAHELTSRGYAVLNITDRGWGGSCGTPQARLQNPVACAKGWNHLLDVRYEVRDVQYLAGLLADEGYVDPQRIGALGESYGGGLSLMLATLKDRIYDDGAGKLVPWTSPVRHLSMRIAGATPGIPWTDLIYSLLPNGGTLDETITSSTADYTPAGVMKQSYVSGLFATGAAPPGPTGSGGYYAPPGADETADLTEWYGLTSAGEPYESNPQFSTVIDQLKNYRSSYYMLQGSATPDAGSSEAPAPMLLANGFTDDLFPVDETVRYYNQERALYPSDPIALTYMDFGHARGQNKAADLLFLRAQANAWLDHYVMGNGPDPGQPVTALTQTCPSSAPSGGPFSADSWVNLHPGALSYVSRTSQTVSSSGGDPQIAKTFDPIAGGGACANPSATPESGTANYDLPTVTGSGYTMIGAPLVVATMSVSGQFPELAERLFDVAPDGTETLVARGVYRPSNTTGLLYFQLHPGAWHFAAGHHPRLQLLGRDVPYLRASNGQFTITVSALGLLLPTHETSGNGIRAVYGASPIPAGATPAPGIKPASLSRFGLSLTRRSTCTTTRSATASAKHKARKHKKRRHKKKAKACIKHKAKKHHTKRKRHKARR